MKKPKIKVAMVWAQFAPYHIDRCEHVGRQVASDCELIAVEVATASDTYAWEGSAGITSARKVTLFPNANYNHVRPWRRLLAMVRVLVRCDIVYYGISYAEADSILLSWILRFCRVKCVVMTDAKFDDRPRRVLSELFKALLLSAYCGAIVAGPRHAAYLNFLGFHRKPVLLNYDVVGNDRIKKAIQNANGVMPYRDRSFLYVGRFVSKKNLLMLLNGYACYLKLCSGPQRCLVMAGSGEQYDALVGHVAKLGISHLVSFPGFLSAGETAGVMDSALALVLVSQEEQWGLVVNEGLVFGLPMIVSDPVGSRDLLVRNLVNGYVVDPNCEESIGRAMALLADDEGLWKRMSQESSRLASKGDVGRFYESFDEMRSLVLAR